MAQTYPREGLPGRAVPVPMENDLWAVHGGRYYGIEPMTDMI